MNKPLPKCFGHELPASSALLEVVQRRKRAIIEKECSGLIEFMDSKHGFDMVGGQELIKRTHRYCTGHSKWQHASGTHGVAGGRSDGFWQDFVIKAFLKRRV